MLVMQMLLPRFLVLEIVLFFHCLHNGQGCKNQIKHGLDKIRSSHQDRPNAPVNETVIQSIISTDPPPLPPKSFQCAVDIHAQQVRYLPLFFHPATEEFLLPNAGSENGQRILRFPIGEPVMAACPGAKLNVNGERHLPVMCLGENDLFDASGQIVPFSELSCSRSIREMVQPDENSPCGPEGQGHGVIIGWKAPSGALKPQIRICHNSELEATYYARHTLFGGALDAKEVQSSRPTYFKEGGFYDQSSADQAYKLRTQRETFKSILGATQGSRVFKYRRSYLAKGHLAPDADFIFKEWQHATYYFLNVAPQWQSFNNGNWKAVEAAVRNYASLTQANLDVFTGTLDPLKLLTDSGSKTRLHLAKKDVDQEQFDLIPVPEFLWKLVYHPQLNQAIVFIGLNNPFFEGDPDQEIQICPDICASEKWFFLYQKNIAKGYLYCCSYADFKAAIEWIPDLGDPDILENVLPPF
ncbi:uncharacterized protein LOC131887344 [Tigriopus californicus]|nr:uncharacterized protein LOC131887344 [Tigriopus californicus]